jgi:hypothetical protein
MVGGGRDILQRTKRKKANWADHILRRNCLLKSTEGKVEGEIEVMEGQRKEVNNCWIISRKGEGPVD